MLQGGLLIYLCGMPMITLSTPFSLDLSMMVLSAGMRDSHPSSPKRFSDDHFLCRNSSNLTETQYEQKDLYNVHKLVTQRPQNKTAAIVFLVTISHVNDLVERVIRASRVLFSSRENCITPGFSNFCRIHWHCSRSLMNMNSTPMC